MSVNKKEGNCRGPVCIILIEKNGKKQDGQFGVGADAGSLFVRAISSMGGAS